MTKNNISSMLEVLKKRMEEIEKNEGFKLVEDESKITNEVILSYDIVGVITDENGIPSVNVIKNNMNKVTGIIPFSQWRSLIEDKIAINEKQHISQEEGAVPDFGEVFTDLSKASSKTFDDVLYNIGEIAKNVSEMVEPTIDKATIKVKIAKLETLRDEAIREDVSTKKFIKKINSKIKDLSASLGH